MNQMADLVQTKISQLGRPAPELSSYRLPERRARANRHWTTLCQKYDDTESAAKYGQVQDDLDEMLVWLEKAEADLEGQKPVASTRELVVKQQEWEQVI